MPAAIASSSTIPNDSPSIDGKQASVAPRSRLAFSASETLPSHVTPSTPRACSAGVSGPSPATHSAAGRSRRANASSSTPRPLRRSWRPTKQMVGTSARIGSAVANVGMSTPFGRISQGPPKLLSTLRCASGDTAVRTASRSTILRSGRRSASYQPLRPGCAAWKVPTAGMSVASRQVWLMPGWRGSWRCSTSGSKTRSASRVRCTAAFVELIGAIDPFEGNRMLGPTLVTPGRGGGPSVGATTRASTPRARSACASPRTWSCTPP